MNRKKAILLIAMLEALLLGIFAVLYVSGTIKLVTFAAIVLAISVVISTVMIFAIRKLPPM